jgi:hypothetical protein
MSTSEPSPTGVFTDGRGTLIATELPEVPFAVSRVFVVRGPAGGAVRGNHTVSGAQLIVLISGTVSVESGSDADHLDPRVNLSEPGARVLLEDGSYIRYTMPNENASILVLCERPFVARD